MMATMGGVKKNVKLGQRQSQTPFSSAFTRSVDL